MADSKHKRVAFYHTGIGDSVGGGGAGRFFIEIYNAVYQHEFNLGELYFITDPGSYAKFAGAGFFSSASANKRFLATTQINNRFKRFLESVSFNWQLLRHRIQLVHICQYYWQDHDHRVYGLRFLPAFLRPKVVVNFVHCNFPYEYFDEKHPHAQVFHKRFDVMFKHLKIDAVFSWYQLFCEFAKKHKLFTHEPLLYPINYYCCNTDNFKPADKKENTVVFASRLDEQKNPMMFLEAVKLVLDRNEKEVSAWKFLLYGNGPLRDKVIAFIKENNLSSRIEFKDNVSNMAPVFSKSACYVSTQFYENFTSLAMHEAMAAGNAIIARNVGQTGNYVKDGYNGYILEEDTADCLAAKIVQFIVQTDKQALLMENSIRIVKEVHSRENFVGELNDFWNRVIELKQDRT